MGYYRRGPLGQLDAKRSLEARRRAMQQAALERWRAERAEATPPVETSADALERMDRTEARLDR